MLLRFIVALLGLAPVVLFGHGIVTNTDQQSFEAVLEGGGHVQIATTDPIVLTRTITITADTTIEGISANAVISGGNNVRMFIIQGVTVTFKGIDLVNGLSDALGGAILAEGSSLILENCVLSSNRAAVGGALAIREGNLTMSNVRAFGNSASDGGALFVTNTPVNLRHSVFEANQAPKGAAISFYRNRTSTIVNTQFRLNRANAVSGGGVYVEQAATANFQDCTWEGNSNRALYNEGNVTLERSTFWSNWAQGEGSQYPFPLHVGPGEGGAVFNTGTIEINNSTFAENSASSGYYVGKSGDSSPSGSAFGGAIYNRSGTASISQTTFFQNRIVYSGMLGEGNGASVFTDGGQVSLANNLFFETAIDDFNTTRIGGPGIGTNSIGTVTGFDSNVFGRQGSIDLRLGTLSFHGGYTPIIPLFAGSPAIDFGPIAITNSIDQRYAVRAAGTAVDAGSFEFNPESHQDLSRFNVTIQTANGTNITTTVTNVVANSILTLQPLTNNQVFSRWTGSVESLRYPLQIVVTQDMTLTAEWTIPMHDLTVLVRGEGTTSPSGTIQVVSGETVTLTATPSQGWYFIGWSNGPASSVAQITVTNDLTITALFREDLSQILFVNITTIGNGSATVSPVAGFYRSGQEITLTATPQTGSEFAGWSGSVTSSQNPLSLTITHSLLNVVANFNEIGFTTNSFTIYWQNQHGQLATWRAGLAGLGHGALMNLPVPGNGWQVVATADAANDSGQELLWMNPAGRLAVWRLNSDNTLTLSNAALINLRANENIWKPIAYSDFDADGDADILWAHQTTGNLAVWYLSNLVNVVNAEVLPTPAPGSDWRVADVKRIDDDNSLDILWQQKSTGRLGVWYMNGLTRREAVMLDTVAVGTAWIAVDIDDLNGDGVKDILWQSNTTGELAFWLLNPGLRMTIADPSRAFLLPGNIRPGTGWKVIGVSNH